MSHWVIKKKTDTSGRKMLYPDSAPESGSKNSAKRGKTKRSLFSGKYEDDISGSGIQDAQRCVSEQLARENTRQGGEGKTRLDIKLRILA